MTQRMGMTREYQPALGELPYAMKAHWARRFHHDLRLAWGDVSFSWALPFGVPDLVGEVRVAIEMEDHQRENLLFEGVHRTGTIMVWDCGSWQADAGSDDIVSSLEAGYLRFTVRGEKVHGVFTLRRKSIGREMSRSTWELRKEADLGASSIFERVSEECLRSIRTGRTKEEIDKEWKRPKCSQPNLFGWDS